jgi:DnaK suppressor protein
MITKGVLVTKKAKKSKKKTATKKAAKKTAKKAAKKTLKKTAKKTAKKAVKKTTAKKSTKKITKKAAVKKTAKKKTVAKKISKKKVARKRSRKKIKSSLTAKDLKFFSDILLQKRRELVGDVNHMENESLKKSRLDAAGDLSSMPIHMADMGTDNFEQEFSLGLMDGERKILHEINLALDRLVGGTYGLCEGTGKEITKPRLEAKPWAKYCIEYATMVEKGLVKEGERIPDEDDDDFYEDEEDELDSNYDLADLEDMDEEKNDKY